MDEVKERLRDLEGQSREQENFNGKLAGELASIATLLKDIKVDISDSHQTVKRVEIQANKTNGRVSRAETDIEKLTAEIQKLREDKTGEDEKQNKEIQLLREDKIKYTSSIKALFITASSVSVVIGLSMQILGLLVYFYLGSAPPGK